MWIVSGLLLLCLYYYAMKMAHFLLTSTRWMLEGVTLLFTGPLRLPPTVFQIRVESPDSNTFHSA